MKYILFVALLLLAISSHSQGVFEKEYDFPNSETPVAITCFPDNSIMMLARQDALYNHLTYLTSSGDTVWTGNFPSSNLAEHGALFSLGNSTIIGSNHNGYANVTRIDLNGNISWSEHLGLGTITSITQFSADKLVACGANSWVDPTGAGGISLLSMWAHDGTLIWAKDYPQIEQLESVAVLSNQNIVCLGMRQQHPVILLCDSTGTPIWTKDLITYGGQDRLGEVISTVDGGFALCYTARRSGNQNELILMKFQSNGNVDWSKAYTDVNFSVTANSLTHTTTGYAVVGRYEMQANQQTSAAIFQFNYIGTYVNGRAYSGSTGSNREAITIAKTSTGGYVIAAAEVTGLSLPHIIGTTAQVIRTDAAFNSGCQYELPSLSQVMVAPTLTLGALTSSALVSSNDTLMINPGSCSITVMCTSTGAIDNQSLEFDMYPNPVSDQIYIRGTNNLDTYCIFDQHGKIVLRGNLNSDSMSIDVKDLPQGIYHLTVSDGSDRVGASRFIRIN